MMYVVRTDIFAYHFENGFQNVVLMNLTDLVINYICIKHSLNQLQKKLLSLKYTMTDMFVLKIIYCILDKLSFKNIISRLCQCSF